MNILYIAQRVPYPPNRGDKTASYNAIRHLAKKHSVCIATVADSYEEIEHARELENQGFEVEVALRRRFLARLNVLKAYITGEPLTVAYSRSRELEEKIARRAASVDFDVVITFGSTMGQYVDLVPGVPLIADFVDMDSRKWELYASWSRWPCSVVYAAEERRLLAHERKLARRASFTLVRTEAEREDCQRLIPGARIEVLSNGVDLDFFRPDGPKPATNGIVFTGVMDYFPNVQAVVYFADEVLPAIRRAVPDATFTIVGARPTHEVLELGKRSGIIVTGQVPDVRPHVRRAAVAVAPLLLARGIQNKVIEAMAMETPVVVTRAAFRGVDTRAGDGVIPSDNAAHFASNVVELLKNPQLAGEIGRKGRQVVKSRYVWEDELGHLESLLLEASPSHLSREPVVAALTQGGGD